MSQTHTRCQIFAVLCGFEFTLIALPLIWFESIYEPTKVAKIKLFILGSSQPSPNNDFVPTIKLISPTSNNLEIQFITSFLIFSGIDTSI